jgi:hypothetical protein
MVKGADGGEEAWQVRRRACWEADATGRTEADSRERQEVSGGAWSTNTGRVNPAGLLYNRICQGAPLPHARRYPAVSFIAFPGG